MFDICRSRTNSHYFFLHGNTTECAFSFFLCPSADTWSINYSFVYHSAILRDATAADTVIRRFAHFSPTLHATKLTDIARDTDVFMVFVLVRSAFVGQGGFLCALSPRGRAQRSRHVVESDLRRNGYTATARFCGCCARSIAFHVRVRVVSVVRDHDAPNQPSRKLCVLRKIADADGQWQRTYSIVVFIDIW